MSATPEAQPQSPPAHRDERDRVSAFRRTRLYGALFRCIRWSFRAAFVPLMRLDVRGLENVPRHGALIVASNHSSPCL
ncbi:MAG: hypothetical protein LC748_12395 [Thermomicrobia bacterium]|nr:hypothetical protein [Thermomicrobia bacterium]